MKYETPIMNIRKFKNLVSAAGNTGTEYLTVASTTKAYFDAKDHYKYTLDYSTALQILEINY